MSAITLEAVPSVPAKYFKHVDGTRAVRLIVIHDMEAPEKGDTAEAIAHYFATIAEKNADGSPVQKSAHYTIDSDSVVCCVQPNDVAYAAPGANRDGLQLELAGYGKQTRDQWLDEYSRAVIDNAARVAAALCVRYAIPPERVQTDELPDPTRRGIVSHAQVSAAFKQSDHTDPGPAFPWDFFFDRLAFHIADV